jgi:AraC-like DNA-binding protein
VVSRAFLELSRPEEAGSVSRRDMRKTGRRTPQGTARVSIIDVDAYLRSCFAGGTSPQTSELARALGVSRGTLAKEIKRLNGMTPGAYLKQEQLVCARRLLLRGLSIEKAARRAGYGTVRTFFRSFRDATGETPATFRAREQNVSRRPSGKRDSLSGR